MLQDCCRVIRTYSLNGRNVTPVSTDSAEHDSSAHSSSPRAQRSWVSCAMHRQHNDQQLQCGSSHAQTAAACTWIVPTKQALWCTHCCFCVKVCGVQSIALTGAIRAREHV